ncbi:ribonuclease HIII [Thermocrinis sp.]
MVDLLLSKGFHRRDVANAFASLTDGRNFVNLYPSGVLLIQGKDAESLKREILDLIKLEDVLVGCDEAGKGDVFGPLVLCCCILTPENFKKVLSLAPKDSKKIKDEEIFKKVQVLENLARFRCLILSPKELNHIYREKPNLNRILDWGYQRLIGEVLKEYPGAKITVDAYSHRNPFGSLINFEHKAEERIEVACASMKARYELLKWLRTYNLPKGASLEVMEKARRMLKQKDYEYYVKVFFLK